MPICTILYNKSNPYGISKDVDGLVAAIGAAGAGWTIRRSDPLEAPVMTDLAIHLEIPAYGWMPWSTHNVLMVNPEWFEETAWAAYMPRFDAVLYKDSVAAAAAVAKGLVRPEQVRVVPWAAAAPEEGGKAAGVPQGNANTGFVWFLGASRSKRAAVVPFLKAWRPEYPPLRIYTTEPLDFAGAAAAAENVRVEVRDLDAPTRTKLGRFFRGHVACSTAEGFGYTAAEAEWCGAFTVLNDLPVYRESYADCSGVHIVPELGADLDAVITAFEATDFDALAAVRRARAKARWDGFLASIKALLEELKAAGAAADAASAYKPKHLPPILLPADCPPISVVTLLYNRRKFFDLACHSLMIQDYPKDKIEWVIVEDSDDPMEDASDRVMAVAAQSAPVRIEYIPLKRKTTVAQKRNIGIERASANIILMMDDDDHYPQTSFRRRVAWLTAHPWKPQAVAATTIACYDLVKGISAVNVPPFQLGLPQRISEATLTFFKGWWEQKRFPVDVQVGEGEGLLESRAGDVLEIPPQQIIVAFSHGKNVSSRRVPSGEGVTPGCFWGFPKEFLEFVHGLAGVKVVADGGSGSGSGKATSKKK